MPRPNRARPVQIKVDAIRHDGDKRRNIPTSELQAFAAAAEEKPSTLRYPRDPSLDPQLVWKGKDEQDGRDLAAEVVPIYIQEKIKPQALVEELRRSAAGALQPQLDLFAGFDAITDLDRKVAFYEYDENWQNRLILGDSLLVMASLAEKEGLRGKVQCIYFDPPYGMDFNSNWQVSSWNKNVTAGGISNVTRQPEQIRAFRDTWTLGVHSYLSYLRDRFVLSRDLLTETGSIFVQISDENIHRVRCLLDEVFGPDNFIALIPFRKKTMPL